MVSSKFPFFWKGFNWGNQKYTLIANVFLQAIKQVIYTVGLNQNALQEYTEIGL